MKFSYSWIKELAGVSLEAQQAAELFTAKSFEVEGVAGDVLEVKILPNRPDCLSHLGLARELCALTNQRFAAPAYEYKVAEHPTLSVTVQDSLACPRYSALAVRGVKIGPSPAWLRERLEMCGLKSINNVVDVTNYVMLELGQPLHAFDLATLDRIVVRPAQAGEKIRTLDQAQTEYTLDPTMLVIADGARVIALAGIKGGAGTGISNQTTNLLLEAANFEPQSIRATSRKLGLRTDASVRFAYGVDPNLTAAALARAGELLSKVAGGTVDREMIDIYPQHRVAQTVILKPAYVRSLLGVEIGEGQIRGILAALGFDVTEHEGQMKVTVPTRRLDVTTPEDLIEEVGRVYGYAAIPSSAPVLPIYDEGHWADDSAFMRERSMLGQILAGAGYSEVYNYVFLSDQLKDLLQFEDLYELAQPQSADYRWLRRSLIPRMLLNVSDNLRYTDSVRLFETGHVFDQIGNVQESSRLGLAISSKQLALNEVFYEIKGTVDLLLEKMGVTDYYYDDTAPFAWDAGAVNATVPGQQALIRLEGGGHVLGFVGTVAGAVASALKIKNPTAVAELDLRALIDHSQREREFEPLPKYPAVVRDIAVLVQAETKIDAILQAIQAADAAGIVQDVDVFDIFVPEGAKENKSVAFHIIYRAEDHTLTDPEVTRVEDGIKKSLQEKLNVQIR